MMPASGSSPAEPEPDGSAASSEGQPLEVDVQQLLYAVVNAAVGNGLAPEGGMDFATERAAKPMIVVAAAPKSAILIHPRPDKLRIEHVELPAAESNGDFGPPAVYFHELPVEAFERDGCKARIASGCVGWNVRRPGCPSSPDLRSRNCLVPVRLQLRCVVRRHRRLEALSYLPVVYDVAIIAPITDRKTGEIRSA